METSEQLIAEKAKHSEQSAPPKFSYDEYEKFSVQYKELIASGFTKPRESQLRSANALFGDTIPLKSAGIYYD